jgi:hypothetical protein
MPARASSAYVGILVYTITPYLNPTLIHGSSYPCTLAPD